MKITRIEGKNLASYSKFDLKLNEGALGESSVFAIVGRTGAGKSTLLDAVMLALYGELPRVAQQDKLELGKGYDAHKPVAIVRLGQGEALAACEFIGTDGVAYRTEWSVRTKRDGALHVAEPKLTHVGERSDLVRNKTEHAREIERLVGLNALEFRRAALLAQNDFAAFLKADRSERAQQLERITHQEQYGAIGKKVHELKGQREEAVREARAGLNEWAELTPEREVELMASSSAAEAVREAAAGAVERLAGHRRFIAEREARVVAAGAARVAEEQAEEAVTARKHDAQRLSWADEAEAHRGAGESRQRAATKLLEEEAEQLRREGEALQADGEAATAVQEAEATKATAVATRGALAAPEVAKARAADTAVVGMEATRQATAAASDELAEVARKAGLAMVESVRVSHAAEEQHEAATKAVASLAGVEEVRRDDALAALDTLLAARMTGREASEEAAAQTGQAEALEVQIGAVAERRGELRGRATLAAEGVRAAGEAPDTAAAHRAVSEAHARSARAEAERKAAVAHARAAAAALVPAQRLEGAVARLREFREQEPQRVVEVQEAHTRLLGAQAIVDAAKAVMHLDEHRAALVEGEACPLCGSEQHPYVEAGAPRLEAALDDELRLHRERHSTLELALATAISDAAASERDLPSLERQAAEAAAAQNEAAGELTVAKEARIDDGMLPSAAESAAEVVAAVAEASRRESAAKKVTAAREAAEAVARELHTLEEEMAPLKAEAGAARALANALVEAAARAALKASEALVHATPRFAAWPGGLDLAAEGVRDAVVAAYREFDSRRTAAERCERDRVAAFAEARAAAGAAVAAQTAADDAALLAQRAATALGEARAVRASLLGGVPTEEAVAAHAAAVATAVTAEGAAATASAAAAARVLSSRSEAKAAKRRAGEAGEAAAEREAALRRALVALDWSEEQFHERLLPALDRGDLRKELDSLSTALVVARAAHNAARERLEELTSPEGLQEEGLAGAVLLAAGELRGAEAALGAANTALTVARRDQASRHEKGGEVAEREAALKPWQRLADLIGGHDGKKFRELAQARTMQALAELANAQLQRFAARYELRHLPEHPLELLVLDHDAGGELRATSSLSGGETFLVSLALALALGRLSSRSVELHTLFVDEGFGSLDADSVDPVVDALRTLAEGGVQVGLISHVRGIAERLPARVEVVKRGTLSELKVCRG